MIIISNEPPKILGSFDKNLLSNYLELGDSLYIISKIYEYIFIKLYKKCLKDEKRKDKFKKLKEEFLKLYERCEAKEKELKEKTGRSNKGPFYYIENLDKRDTRILKRLRRKTR